MERTLALTMKPVPGAAASLLLVIAVTAPLLAQVDCAQWTEFGVYGTADSGFVERCLQGGANPNERNSIGYTPLHLASQSGTVEMVAALLAAGADPNARQGSGLTPLHFSSSGGTVEMVRALLAASPDANVRSDDGRTPLHEAAAHGSAQIIVALLAAGAEVDAQTADGRTPLHRGAASGSEGAIAALLASGADANVRSDDGETPLHRGAAHGSAQNIAALLAAGAEVDAQSADGRTPLHRGAASGSEGAIAALAAAGANLNARTRDGLTPLRIAALRHGYGVVVRALLAGGATPDADALDLAMQVSRSGNVVGLTRREEERGAYCAALPEANLAAGTAVTLVGPELALSGVIDRSIESFPGELVEDLAMRLTNADHRGSFADCERLQLALFDLDPASAKHHYYRVTTNVADADTYSDLLAFIGRFDTQRTAEGQVAVEITDSNPNARVRVCNSRESVLLALWAGTPLTSERLWRESYYLGYEAVPSCEDGDFMEIE